MIYVIRGHGGNIKIGYTGNTVEERFQSVLQGFKLLGTTDGTLRQERLLHSLIQFELDGRIKCCGGEWYNRGESKKTLKNVVGLLLNQGVNAAISYLQRLSVQSIQREITPTTRLLFKPTNWRQIYCRLVVTRLLTPFQAVAFLHGGWSELIAETIRINLSHNKPLHLDYVFTDQAIVETGEPIPLEVTGV